MENLFLWQRKQEVSFTPSGYGTNERSVWTGSSSFFPVCSGFDLIKGRNFLKGSAGGKSGILQISANVYVT